MAQLVWTSTAIQDLNSIAEYIEMDSEIAAKKFIKEIIYKAEGLASQPFKGRPIPEKFPGGYRQILQKLPDYLSDRLFKYFYFICLSSKKIII